MARPARTIVRLLVGLVLAVPLLFAQGATAQGTGGTFPAPISTPQLLRYAERLGLSDEQRAALEAFHDDYRRAFRILRDGEIAAVLAEQRDAQGGIRSRHLVERFLENLDRAFTKIRMLDERLFDRLLPILADMQLEQLPRIRLSRERARYDPRLIESRFGRSLVDLSELFQDLDLSPEALAVCDPIIAQYERRLTGMMRRQSDAVVTMSLDLMEALEARGYAGISEEELQSDPDLQRTVIEEIGSIYAGLNAQLAKGTAELTELNTGTFRRVRVLLPEAKARALRDRYYRESYPELDSIVALSQQEWMDQALELEGLTDEQSGIIAVARDDFRRNVDRVLDEMFERVEGFWLAFSPFELDQEAMAEYQGELRELAAEARRLESAMNDALRDSLGKETLVEIRASATAAAVAAKARAPGRPPAAGSSVEAGGTEAFVWSGDPFLPARITRGNAGRYAMALGLDETRRADLLARHGRYVDRFEQLEAIDDLGATKRSLREVDSEASSLPAALELIETVHNLRRRALEAIIEIDGMLFEELGEIAGEEQSGAVDRLRLQRLRRVYLGAASGRYSLGRDRTSEAGVDVGMIATSQIASPEALRRIDLILLVYEPDTLEPLRERFEAQLGMQRAMDRWAAEFRAAMAEDLAAVAVQQQRFQEMLEAPAGRVAEASAVVIALNRGALDAIVTEVADEPGRLIRRGYDRAAFPAIFDDPTALDRPLAAALELEDLGATRRRDLTELIAWYRPEYGRLSREMVGLLRPGVTNVVGLDAESFRRWQEEERLIARLRFERNELNARAIRRLETLLTEDQVRRVGGLPPPPEGEE